MRLLVHPLEDPLPVLADVSLRAGAAGSYAGWSGERVVWSDREVPYVVTHSEVSVHTRTYRGGQAEYGSYRGGRQTSSSESKAAAVV